MKPRTTIGNDFRTIGNIQQLLR